MLALLPHQGDHSLVEHTEENHGTSDEIPTPEIGTSISSEHKLDAGEIQKIHDLYEGIQDKSIQVSGIDESKELIKVEECYSSIKHYLLKNHEQLSYGCSILSMWKL